MSDLWGWAELETVAFEPGLYALQTRPFLDVHTGPLIAILTFHTEAGDPVTAFRSSIDEVTYPVTGYTGAGSPVHGDGIGNWSADKNYIVWLYDNFISTEDVYVAIADTSYRPVSDGPISTRFSEDLFFYPITANGLYSPRMVRSVPADSTLISFLAQATSGSSVPSSLYFIPSFGTPSIVATITAADLGGMNIIYYAFSADGRYAVFQVDDRMVIYNRDTASVEVDIVESYDYEGYQFSEESSMLYYVKGGKLLIRFRDTGWGLDTTVSETDTFECSGTQPFVWQIPRLSPDHKVWLNIFAGGCGGPFDHDYRSFLRFRDESFILLASDDCSRFASGWFLGDFSNDSRWYAGGDGNINGDSKVAVGPNPAWTTKDQGSASTGTHQIRSFQAF